MQERALIVFSNVVPFFVIVLVACLRLWSLTCGDVLQGVRHNEGTIHQLNIFGIWLGWTKWRKITLGLLKVEIPRWEMMALPTCWEAIEGIYILNAAIKVGKLMRQWFEPNTCKALPLDLDQPLALLCQLLSHDPAGSFIFIWSKQSWCKAMCTN